VLAVPDTLQACKLVSRRIRRPLSLLAERREPERERGKERERGGEERDGGGGREEIYSILQDQDASSTRALALEDGNVTSIVVGDSSRARCTIEMLFRTISSGVRHSHDFPSLTGRQDQTF